jgi:5S rRNA maturation endonuclease (ribonuclease M5)
MEFFKKFFREDWQEYDTGELAVKCPFPHKDEKGNQYYESVPSAHINQDKSLFHCKVCGQGLSEAHFLSKIQGVSYKDSLVLLKELKKHHGEEWYQFHNNFLASEGARELWKSLGLNKRTAMELEIGYEAEGISFPVYIYGEILDVRNYLPNRKPKVISRSGSGLPKGSKTLPYPFDLWKDDEQPTLLCAGEKDMAIARQMGFNALTFTGGEQAFPKLFKASFKGKKVYICYDNDQAGQEGSRKIASMLKDCGATPYVVTGHYSVCTGKGEDIHDYFIKYGQTADSLRNILYGTIEFTEEDHRTEQQRYIPLISIEEATKGKYANRLVSSRISVVATYEESYHVPDYVELKKVQDGTDKCTFEKGDVVVFTLDEENIKDSLELMDSNLKEPQISASIRRLAGVPKDEPFMIAQTKSRVNVFKAVVTDDTESGAMNGDESATMMELLVYSIGEKLRPSQKYRIFYKPTAHPLKGQQIVGIVTKLEESDNSVNRFKMNKEVLETLKCFQVQPRKKLTDKMDELYERSKGIIGVEARADVTFTTELFFHTPLHFKFGRRIERAYLDVMMVGDPRTGKSQAAKKLLDLYQLGLITSLKTATTAGLLGGSDQTAGGWKTKLGLIPRNHKSALVLEEFSGGGQELISKLTEVRSSGRVRLTRVNGSTDVPAQVRMLSISNPSTHDKRSIPLRKYPNGINVLLDLIGASEDIARYDFFLLVDEPEEYTSPLVKVEQEPYPVESYQNRIRWVWSRTEDQIIISDEVQEFIVKCAEELNKDFNTHIKLFGPEAWKKLTRTAIATAGMVCSMSEDGENLIVEKSHVQWAHKFLIDCYDNDLFKLREYVDMQRSLVVCDDAAVFALQGLYNSHAIMLNHLEMITDVGPRELQMMSGLDQKDFTKVTNQLMRYKFIEYGNRISPTQRFRTAMTRIDKQPIMPKLGER